MTQIANVRTFNGSSDKIQLTLSQLQTTFTNWSFAAIVKPNDSALWRPLLSANEPNAFGHGLDPSEGIYVSDGSSTPVSPTSYITNAMGWTIMGTSKATGSNFPRWHRYRYDTLAWDHQADAATAVDPVVGATSELYIGHNGAVNAEFWNGSVAMIAIWTDQLLSDGDYETLPSSLAAWTALTPSAAWLLDQASVATPVPDLIGGCDESAITGTTVTAESGLAFDVGGAAAVSPIRSQYLDYDYSR